MRFAYSDLVDEIPFALHYEALRLKGCDVTAISQMLLFEFADFEFIGFAS